MNRYDHLIQEYLQQNKSLALEKIGLFTLTSEPFVTENNNNTGLSKIEFTYDRRTATSPELIEYIAASLNKNKNLVAADIESYLLETRQWINISKSYQLEGMGEVVMDNSGALAFRQTIPLSPKEEESRRRRPLPKETTYAEPGRRKRGGVFAFATIIILLILGGIGWGAYTYFFAPKKGLASNDQPAASSSDTTPKTPDTTNQPPRTDTASTAPTTAAPVASSTGADSNHYKYIYELTLSKERAISRTTQLNTFGNKAGYDSVAGGAFTRYRLYIDVTASSTDTLKIKDSLTRYLQRSILIKKY